MSGSHAWPEPAAEDAWAPPPMWSQAWPAPASPVASPAPLVQPPAAETAPEQAPAVPRTPDTGPPPAPPLVDVSLELIKILGAVTTMCDRVLDFVDADRAERLRMIEVLAQLSRAATAPEPSRPFGNGERVVGGSMVPGPDPTIDLRRPETPVEVRCRFGDRWVDGFEIFEVLQTDPDVRYRLRRRVDGVVLPELFGAADIRHIETFEELTPSSLHDRHWSAL